MFAAYVITPRGPVGVRRTFGSKSAGTLGAKRLGTKYNVPGRYRTVKVSK